MREIKFRMWNNGTKEMSEPFDLGDLDDGLLIPNLEDTSKFRIDNCEIMQYTGLKDKNGKEIYEGDIVTRGEIMCYVKFDDKGRFIVFNNKIEEGWWLDTDWEVIGNIYENLDLLEDK